MLPLDKETLVLDQKSSMRSSLAKIALALAVLVASAPVQSATAYSTALRWSQSTTQISYAINGSLSTALGLPGQQATIETRIRDAAFQWNIASRLKMNNNIPYSESVSRVTSADLGSDDTVFANVTWQLSGSSVVRAWTRFNTNSKFDWNTNGTMGLRGDGVWDADVFKVAVHEFGHWLALGDAPDEVWEGGFNAMMWFDPQGSKSSLFMDDKEGATMMYGLQTGFEVAQFLGLLPNPAPVSPSVGVGAYNTCSGNPDY